MKDCTTCKYGYDDERLGIPMCHHPKRFSKDCVDFDMHEEKETEESEKPIDIDFEQELYNHFGQVKDFTLGMRIGQYFYELGKQSGSSEIPNDLEEAANEYAKLDEEGKWKDGGKYKGFIAGAKWHKAQILKEAVEGVVCYGSKGAYVESDFLGTYDTEVYGEPGDKVSVIVIPNTDEK